MDLYISSVMFCSEKTTIIVESSTFLPLRCISEKKKKSIKKITLPWPQICEAPCSPISSSAQASADEDARDSVGRRQCWLLGIKVVLYFLALDFPPSFFGLIQFICCFTAWVHFSKSFTILFYITLLYDIIYSNIIIVVLHIYNNSNHLRT